MSSELKIFDVSYLVHMGSKSDYRSNTVMGLQCGGLIFLMEKVFAHMSRGASVALAFDSAITSKKETFAEYKATRTRDMSIFIQNKMILDFCTKMGLPVYKEEGYEADEVIYNLVQANNSSYESIDIYCHDADICCNVLREGIRCVGCGGDPLISKENYPYEIFKDAVIPYNAILPYILVFGKRSNNISKLKLQSCKDNTLIFNDMLGFFHKNYEPKNWSDSRSIMSWLLRKNGKLPDEDVAEISRRVKMIYPRKCNPEQYLVRFGALQNLNRAETLRFLRIFNMQASAMNLGMSGEMRSLLDTSGDDKRIILGYKSMAETGNLLASADLSSAGDIAPENRSSIFTMEAI